MQAHLRPTAPVAPRAVLPGDPKRAMELATALMERPLMSNLSRGLWGYFGSTSSGRELTVQSTGIGGPSAAVVLAELADLGVRAAIRVGTCAALDDSLAPGQALVVDAALADGGVTAALAGDSPERPDAGLTAALAHAAPEARRDSVASTDLYYDPNRERRRAWRDAGALAVEMSAAALFAVGRHANVAVACALVVAESAAGERLTDEELDEATLALGERAAIAVDAQAPAALS